MLPSSLVAPIGCSNSTCGYCSPPGQRSASKTSKSYGLWAHDLSPYDYQDMIDSNWRRSGKYCYKMDNLRTCCPHLTIRLPADRYTPGKQQKRALAKLSREILGPSSSTKRKGKDAEPFDLSKRWYEIEAGNDKEMYGEQGAAGPSSASDSSRGRFELTLVPASFTEEKYALFRRYQIGIHRESNEDVSDQAGFTRFLVHSPIRAMFPEKTDGRGRRVPVKGQQLVPRQPSKSDSPVAYGTYHHEYRIDGKLVAVGVLDILPRCVSSVYLFYDPAFEHLELGKVSAMREILLVQELQHCQAMEYLTFYYMGYYIHDCQKMKYKATFRPSEILDLHTREWLPFDQIEAKLDGGDVCCFLGPEDQRLRIRDLRQEARQNSPERSASGAADHSIGTDAMDEDEDEEDKWLQKPVSPSFLDPDEVLDSLTLLSTCFFIEVSQQDKGLQSLLSLVSSSEQNGSGTQVQAKEAVECVAALGEDIGPRCIQFLQ